MFVGFGEGAPEDAGAGYDDLGYYAVRLARGQYFVICRGVDWMSGDDATGDVPGLVCKGETDHDALRLWEEAALQ